MTAKMKEARRAALGIEGDILELENMARLAERDIEDLLGQDSTSITGRRDFYFIESTRADGGIFAIRHLRLMAEELGKKYSALLEA